MFDPSDVAVKNGNFFGVPSYKNPEIQILSVPWDVTTSYRDGTSRGPAAILQASTQLDFHSPFRKNAWETKISTHPISKNWLAKSKKLRKLAKVHIQKLESGKPVDQKLLKKINAESATFHQEVYEFTKSSLKKSALVTLGGDHSVSYGSIKAYAEKYSDLSILHIDAHADLREDYEGFPHSHASIMNLVEQLSIKSLVQVGIRDISPDEATRIDNSSKIHCFFDWDLKRKAHDGKSWKEIATDILKPLSKNVYLSFDVDGLDPKFCPNTGTPVMGGLDISQVYTLLELLEKSGKKLVGADLVEVAPDPKNLNDWDANVGARILFQLCQFVKNSTK
jgi:agmatinase